MKDQAEASRSAECLSWRNRCSKVKSLWESRTLSQCLCHKGRTGSAKINSCFQSGLAISAQPCRQFSVLFHCGTRAITERVRAGFALMGFPHFTAVDGVILKLFQKFCNDVDLIVCFHHMHYIHRTSIINGLSISFKAFTDVRSELEQNCLHYLNNKYLI